MWHRVSVCSDYQCPGAERFWDAGLNHDGSRCLIFADCDDLFVWDVRRGRLECVCEGPESPEERQSRSFGLGFGQSLEPGELFTIGEGPGADRYRVFGKNRRGRTADERLGLRLEVDLPAGLVRVVRLAGGVEVVALNYEWSSGDRAAASFSEDGGLIAVLEPYHVTFFRL